MFFSEMVTQNYLLRTKEKEDLHIEKESIKGEARKSLIGLTSIFVIHTHLHPEPIILLRSACSALLLSSAHDFETLNFAFETFISSTLK